MKVLIYLCLACIMMEVWLSCLEFGKGKDGHRVTGVCNNYATAFVCGTVLRPRAMVGSVQGQGSDRQGDDRSI